MKKLDSDKEIEKITKKINISQRVQKDSQSIDVLIINSVKTPQIP